MQKEEQGRRPADTGARVASIAAKHGDIIPRDVRAMSDDELEAFCADVRSAMASLRRQNER